MNPPGSLAAGDGLGVGEGAGDEAGAWNIRVNAPGSGVGGGCGGGSGPGAATGGRGVAGATGLNIWVNSPGASAGGCGGGGGLGAAAGGTGVSGATGLNIWVNSPGASAGGGASFAGGPLKTPLTDGPLAAGGVGGVDRLAGTRQAPTLVKRSVSGPFGCDALTA